MGARTRQGLRLKGLAVLAICLVARAGAGAQAEEPPACPVTGPNAAPYLVGPGDLLRVNVWKEPELTLELTVRIDGMITLPLLGDVQASGRAPSELASRIALELEEFIEKPHVSVAVVEARSARVYVVGRISRPGELPLSACMTVLQALALAGGLTEFAKADKISIVRGDGSVVPVNYERIVDGKDVAQNAYLAAGDTIVVP